MSADNGFVIRKNKNHKFVLQEYCASAESYPGIEHSQAQKFDTLEEAVLAYSKLDQQYAEAGYPTEYGLSIHIDEVTV